MSLRVGLLFIAISVFGSAGNAQEAASLPRVTVELKSDRKEPGVGDPFAVTLLGSALPEGSRLRAGGGLQQGFTVTDSGKIIALRAGQIQVPSLQVVNSDGNVIAETDPFLLDAKTALGENENPGEPPKPEPPMGPQSLSLPLALSGAVGLLVALCLGLVLWRIIRWVQKRRTPSSEIAAPPELPDSIALRRFQAIEREKYYEKGQHKRHFFEISETLKAYLSDRYSIDARESTTSELFGKLADLVDMKAMSDEDLRIIRETFGVLDLVKFTDYLPDSNESIAQLDEARKIVVRTKSMPRVLTREGPTL